MPDFNASLAAVIASAIPTRTKANTLGGRIRVLESVFVAPASGAAPAIADRIIWGKLPVRARLLPHLGLLQFTAGTASCTLNLGDNIVPARHLAATAITSAGSAVPNVSALAKAAVGDITNGSAVIQNCRPLGAFQVGDLIAGTGIPTGSRILSVSGNTATISNAATATTASLAITVSGGAYETSDDTANAANGFVSTTDDCTLISVVAGAQVANNQVIKLTMPFVVD